jgi:hypothetical protein
MTPSKVEDKKDFLGQTIKDGDRVISHYSGGYAGLRWGTVVGFTPKMVRVVFNTKSKWQTRYASDLIVMSEDQEKALLVKLLKE